MGITVTSINPADEPTAEQAYQITAAALAADVPDFPPACRDTFFGILRHPSPNRPGQHLLARVGAEPAGYLRLVLPDRDNTANAHVELSVPPQHRRRGVGRALYERAVTIARAHGRKRLMTETVAALPGGVARDDAGAAFARAVGAKPALPEVRRRLDLSAGVVTDAERDELLAQAWRRAEGYSLVQWQQAAPDEYLDDLAYLDSRLVKDAPMGELAWEPERVDAARMRAVEQARQAWRWRSYHTGVRHDATGRLVAWTALDLQHCTPEHAWQQITIVEPRHRGHRLGTIVKVENLRYARAHEPALREIDTWNAEENAHMIGINEQLGFRAVDAWINWQQEL